MLRMMSEARLNDLVYITMKYLYFQPLFGDGSGPRECDIRVCMNVAVPQTITGPCTAWILLPDEVAPASHDTQYSVDTDAVFAACRTYMEDHWMKAPVGEVWPTGPSGGDTLQEMQQYFETVVVPGVMSIDEADCAKKTEG